MAVFLMVLGMLAALICGFFAVAELFGGLSVSAGAWAASSALGWVLVGLGAIHDRLGDIRKDLTAALKSEPAPPPKEVPTQREPSLDFDRRTNG